MIKKTIGKVSAKLLSNLYRKRGTIFSIEDAAEILKFDHNSTKKFLFKMKARNLIVGMKAGKYIIVPEGIIGEYIGNWHVAAREISNSKEYYISHFSAMEIHNMLTQPLTIVYISSPKRQLAPKKFKQRFKFIKIKQGNIWGIEENWVTNSEKVRVSNIERTILDCLWQPQYAGGITEIAKGIWIVKDKIDYSRLLNYVLRFKKYVVIKRLGFILETLRTGKNILPLLRNSINRRYDVLDPILSSDETFKNTWNLIANINPDEIRNIIKT